MLHSYEAPQQSSASSSWYMPEEKQLFKEQARQESRMLRRMKENGSDLSRMGAISNDMLCPFGLEQQLVSRDFTKKRIITKILVRIDVLTEQARHASSEADDKQERIANASRQHSEWSTAQAQTIGTFQAFL